MVKRCIAFSACLILFRWCKKKTCVSTMHVFCIIFSFFVADSIIYTKHVLYSVHCTLWMVDGGWMYRAQGKCTHLFWYPFLYTWFDRIDFHFPYETFPYYTSEDVKCLTATMWDIHYTLHMKCTDTACDKTFQNIIIRHNVVFVSGWHNICIVYKMIKIIVCRTQLSAIRSFNI